MSSDQNKSGLHNSIFKAKNFKKMGSDYSTLFTKVYPVSGIHNYLQSKPFSTDIDARKLPILTAFLELIKLPLWIFLSNLCTRTGTNWKLPYMVKTFCFW